MLDPKLLMLLAVGTLLLMNGIIDIGRRRSQGRRWEPEESGVAPIKVDEPL